MPQKRSRVETRPGIWAPGANFPGTAFTRSLGDSGELRAVVDRAAVA